MRSSINITAVLCLASVVAPALASPLSLPWLRSLKSGYLSDTSISGSVSAGVAVGADVHEDLIHDHDRRGLVDAVAAYNISSSGSSELILRSLNTDSLFEPRDLDSGLLSLNGYYDKAQQHSNNLQSYSAQVEANHEKWAQEGLYGDTLYELREYNAALYSFHALFSHLGRDKGLAHYDRQNDVETLLKNVVNLHKYTLNYLDCMVAEIPVLGPILAPVLYDIKCVLDLVLNGVENLADATINDLQPLLRGVIGSTADKTCQYGVKILGLCV